MNQEFHDWLDRIKPDLTVIYKKLREQISDEPAKLVQDLLEIEPWYSRATFLQAEANAWLDRGAAFYKPDKQGNTEFDRKILLEASLSDVREIRDKMEGLVESIKQRIILGESILRYQTQFKEPEMKKAVNLDFR